MKTEAQKIVDAILTELTSRKGFDYTWDSIDEETQKEIISECKKLVQKELKPINKELKKSRNTIRDLAHSVLEAYSDLDHYYQADDVATQAIDLCIELGYLENKDGKWIYHY